jgi:hypothetical protein
MQIEIIGGDATMQKAVQDKLARHQRRNKSMNETKLTTYPMNSSSFSAGVLRDLAALAKIYKRRAVEYANARFKPDSHGATGWQISWENAGHETDKVSIVVVENINYDARSSRTVELSCTQLDMDEPTWSALLEDVREVSATRRKDRLARENAANIFQAEILLERAKEKAQRDS